MKRRLKNCGGYSLVEIIVTFALIGLFLSSASLVLGEFMAGHNLTNTVAREQSVGITVMETVTSALSNARTINDGIFADAADVTELTVPSGADESRKKEAQLYVEAAGNADAKHGTLSTASVWYTDGKSGRKVHMYVEDHRLKMKYYPTAKTVEGTVSEPVVWELGENVYNGCEIAGFQVEQLKSMPPEGSADPAQELNSLCVTLTFTSNRGGELHSYTISRSLECYNLAERNILLK